MAYLGDLYRPYLVENDELSSFQSIVIYQYTASPHTMKDVTGVPPERPFIYVSGA